MPKYKIIKDYEWGSAIMGNDNGKIITANDVKPKVGDIIEGGDIVEHFIFNQRQRGLSYTIYYDVRGQKTPYKSIIPESSLQKIEDNQYKNTGVVLQPIKKEQNIVKPTSQMNVDNAQKPSFLSKLTDIQKAIIVLGLFVILKKIAKK
jgi:hypothetical protein